MQVIEYFMNLLAVTVTRPEPYHTFHIAASLIGVPCAVAFALYMSGLSRKGRLSGVLVLRFTGFLLLLAEIFKQLFLCFVYFDHGYDLWYLPFQLCSMPMYLCLFYPKNEDSGMARIFAAFIADFGLIGGVMTLLWPDGIMYSYIVLTLHGFLWHLTLLYLAVFVAASGLADISPRSYSKVVPLYLVLAAAAFLINLIAGPDGNAEMFYISPWHITEQPVFRDIYGAVGIIPGIAVYLLANVIGGYIVHLILGFIFGKKKGGTAA